MKRHIVRRILAAAALTVACANAWAHGDSHPKSRAGTEAPAVTAFGKSGDAAKATRTVNVAMSDTMRFTPDRISVKRGETVRFVVTNEGRAMHEMVLGRMEDLKQHAELMRKFPAMEHDEPYMAHVAPGKKETIVWQFTQPGDVYFGCLVPGHFEAGMIGKIAVR